MVECAGRVDAAIQARSTPREGARMRAAIFNEIGKEFIEIYDDVEVADPGPGEVRVKLHAAGVCHSDLSAMNGTLPQPAPAVSATRARGRSSRWARAWTRWPWATT